MPVEDQLVGSHEARLCLTRSAHARSLLPEDFARVRASVDQQLAGVGGIDGLRRTLGNYAGDIPDWGLYLAWKYPRHILAVVDVGERVQVEPLGGDRFRVSSEWEVPERLQTVSRARRHYETRQVCVRGAFSYADRGRRDQRVAQPETLLRRLDRGPYGVWLYVWHESRNYVAGARLIFHRDPWQPALRRAGACWLSKAGCDE
ncbi:hypothetical protein [Alkalilimnicola ehrlichii]|uniref:hypothetical protein n=1 Tax=Alkalilimnicola ehrlichii TaxID=351052 RepID=UPI0011C03B4E|nr:hypothetical protein [Alkalilimnicola ehrlichii]